MVARVKFNIFIFIFSCQGTMKQRVKHSVQIEYENSWRHLFHLLQVLQGIISELSGQISSRTVFFCKRDALGILAKIHRKSPVLESLFNKVTETSQGKCLVFHYFIIWFFLQLVSFNKTLLKLISEDIFAMLVAKK